MYLHYHVFLPVHWHFSASKEKQTNETFGYSSGSRVRTFGRGSRGRDPFNGCDNATASMHSTGNRGDPYDRCDSAALCGGTSGVKYGINDNPDAYQYHPLRDLA